MSAAAIALHRSQPALSRQVSELENELGFRIFARTSNRIVGFTPRGQQVLAAGERIVRELDALEGLSARAPDTVSELRIATTHTHARYTLPGVVRRFARAWPGVLLNLRQADPAQCFQIVARGEADLGVTVEATSTPRDVVALPVYKLGRCVVAPRNHPLSRGRLTLARIAEYPVIAYSRPPDWKWIFEDAFAQLGLTPRVVFSALDADVSKTYVSLGLGVAVLATLAFDPQHDTGLVARNADHLFLPGILTVVFRRGAYITPPVQSFLAELCPHVRATFLQECVDGAPIDRERQERTLPLVRSFASTGGV